MPDIAQRMDTRRKILSVEEIRKRAGSTPIRWISGAFDPLLAEHARRLSAFRSSGELLAVVVQDSTESLLSQRARAELVAALAVVDFVTLQADGVPRDHLDDHSISERFVERVRRRHNAKGSS